MVYTIVVQTLASRHTRKDQRTKSIPEKVLQIKGKVRLTRDEGKDNEPMRGKYLWDSPFVE